MQNKKSQASIIGIILVIAVVIGVITLIYFVVSGRGETAEQAIVQQAIDIAAISKAGDVASIGIYVRDLSDNDVNTKIIVPVYCLGDDGAFIIDGTSSSTTTEITGKTTVGTVVTCWAFNSTIQTLSPTRFTVDDEVEHIVIDAYQVAVLGGTTIYDSTLTNANAGVVNLSIGADGSDSFAKMKFKNNNTDAWIPLGGFFYDVIELTNISTIDMTGGVVLFGFKESPATSISKSDVTTAVTTRKSQWDYVFDLSPDAEGRNVLIIDENDYIETSPITFESAVGCSNANDGGRAIIRAFTRGYYRETKNTGVAYGHETDASVASVISADIFGTTIHCNV